MPRMKGAAKRLPKSSKASDIRTKYEPRFCNVVINRGRKGHSRAQIAVYLGVTRKTLARWEGAHPEFKEAMEVALDQALAWWETKAQRSLEKKHFQAGMLGKMMAARYPDEYDDRMRLLGDKDAPLTVITRRIIDARDDKR